MSVKSSICIASFVALGSLCACGPGNENAAAGAVGGAAIGAGAGAIIGHQTGDTGAGAAIGGATGAVVGGAIGAARDDAEAKTTEEDRFIERQKQEMERQQREIEDVRRQKYHDDYFRSRYLNGDSEEPPPQDGFGGY
jgi:outer membrane lipoprotein SlyB